MAACLCAIACAAWLSFSAPRRVLLVLYWSVPFGLAVMWDYIILSEAVDKDVYSIETEDPLEVHYLSSPLSQK